MSSATLLKPRTYVVGGINFTKGVATPVSDTLARQLKGNEHFVVNMTAAPPPPPAADEAKAVEEPGEAGPEGAAPAGTEQTLDTAVGMTQEVARPVLKIGGAKPDATKEGAVAA